MLCDKNIQSAELLDCVLLAKLTAQKMQETADLVTFSEEIPNGKLHFLCRNSAVKFLVVL